jgi:hypothetical protein
MYLQLQADLDAKQDALIMQAISEERALFEEQLGSLREQLRFAEEENGALRLENDRLRRSPRADGAVASPTATSTGAPVNNTGKSAAPATPAAPAPSQWDAVDSMRASIAARDEKSRAAHEDRIRLALLLANEKRTVFRLAEKLRALVMQYAVERGTMMQRMTELQNEVAELRGTDFLTGNAVQPEDDTNSISNSNNQTESDPPPPPLSPSLVSKTSSEVSQSDSNEAERVAEAMNALQQQLTKAFAVIQRMQSERRELILYQSKSEKAIRFLVSERERLISQASSGSTSSAEK